MLCLLPVGIGGVEASAQAPAGGPQNPSATGGEVAPPTAPVPAGGVAPVLPGPVIPGPAPQTLPLPPSGGFGTPNLTSSPYAINNEVPTLASPPTLRLLPLRVGILPLQAYNPEAPAVLIHPLAALSETFTDNVFYVHSPRKFAAITQPTGGLSISVDTPRLQAVATGSATGSLYLPSSLSSFNQVYGNLYANGHSTLYPGLAYLDAQSSITQSTTAPGFGFQNLSTLPSNQQTQQFINNVSPYLIHSFDGFVDTELIYRFASSNYGGNRTVVTAPTGLNTLNNTTLNEGTFVAATGENYQRLLARFTGDASEYDTPPPAQNTQVSAYNDVEYRFTPTIAALGRAGYQNIRYPSSPAATFAGATWLVGGQIGTVDPVQPKYFSLEYGKIQGVYGFTGVSQFYLTPTLVFSANASHGVSSQSQYFQNSLAASALSPSGGIVDQYTGLPTAFYNPGIGLTNNVYRQHIYNAGLTDTIPPNSYSLYGFYYEQQSLTPPTTAPTKSAGISLSYSRDMRPDLRGSASVGYANSVNSPVVSPTGISSGATGSFYTVSGQVGVNYLLARNLTASLFYTFSYQSSGTFVTGGRNGDVIANLLQLQLSKTF